LEKFNVFDLLKQLELLVSKGESIYPPGFLPSQRYHPFLPYSREDDNLFFTATVAYTLNSHLSLMNHAEKYLAKSMVDSAISIFPLFRNKEGRPTYNFWQTKPSRHFPNGLFMKSFEHFRIPDDADDTALAHLLLNHSLVEKEDLIKRFSNHSNLNKKPIINTWPEFKRLKAVSTFFGEKMRIEFDAVVMCNSLLFLLEEKAEGPFVEDSLKYVEGIIERDYILSNPFYTAPNYPRSELIIYHVARLLQKFPEISLSKHRGKLVENLDALLGSFLAPLNRLIANNAQMLLGVQKSLVSEIDQSVVINDEKGYFFHAGMMSAFENSIAQKLSQNSLFHLRYRSKALNIVMLIENELLRRKL
jgi:hypothetical protein